MSATSLIPNALLGPIFDAASDAFVASDADGTICQVNDACLRLLGYTREELLGEPIEVLVPAWAGDHAKHRQAYHRTPRARGMGLGLELAARHKDGPEIRVDIALTPLLLDEQRFFVASLRDMRQHADAFETLNVQATALRSAANGVVITDRKGLITWVNPAALRITGYSEQELIGTHTRVLKSGQHAAAFYAQLWATVARGETWSGTIINRRKDGAHYAEEQTIAPVRNPAGTITHFIAIKQDISARLAAESALARAREELASRLEEIEKLNAQLSEQVIRDPLTGLHNRRYLHEALGSTLCAASRNGEPVTLAMLDVDWFKRVNDTHGHAVGDQVLVALGGVLRERVRGSDLVCRFGGEEFVIVLQGAAAEVARSRAEALREAFRSLTFIGANGTSFHTTISIGLAMTRDTGESIASLLERADAALYQAKSSGRDRVVLSAEGDPIAAVGTP